MAEVSWTPEQQNVINFRNRNILVSAAAGSGKTAVLVERIIARITRDEPPIDIDRMLVVTFTKAAAAEMKERVAAALEEKIKEEPENENLMRQSALVHNAMITTIDSFCNFVVRNYFGEIGLDPNFRIADEGEIKLLEQDVLAEVFEANYARENNEIFLRLVDSYSDKSDSRVREIVKQIYDKSASNPWPKEWIANVADNYHVETVEEVKESLIIHDICQETIRKIQSAKHKLEELLEVASEPDGPGVYIDGLNKYLEMFEGCEEFSNIDHIYGFFSGFNKFSIGRCVKPANPEKKEKVLNGANSMAVELLDVRDKYFSRDLEELVEQLKRMRPVVDELSRLSLEYYQAVANAKRERRIVDFSDVEHFALNIFVDEKTHKPTDTAREFRKHYAEIMIDEYQDSNMVQEQILKSISGEEDGNYNMFMVGDVKQSIYRFRLAEPELFMDKYRRFSSEESKEQKIDLAMNFRSRSQVLDFSNDIFYKIMSEDLGSVSYDDKAALYFGAKSAYPPNPDMNAEIMLVDMKDEGLMQVVEDDDSDSKKVEALMIAQKILNMKESLKVMDKASKEERNMRFSDAVILVRSTKTSGDSFSEVLNSCGIPTYVESSEGYFSTFEIQVIMAMLQILDNPLQDIPMATVLKSPIVGMDDEELAEIRTYALNNSFSQSAWDLMTREDDGEASNEKLKSFYEIYSELRKMVCDTPIHELIQKLLDKTDFLNYAASMPAGEQRYKNIKMLLEKAVAYEKTSYKGLYHFVRYINLLKKYEIDYGEADTLGENSDVVRIMTIHKSKGLEFPVVFVAGMGRKFDQRDSKGEAVLHARKLLGISEMTCNPKTKKSCLIKDYIAEINQKETLGEELRVLYVALTRAKEKLIITGHISDAEKELTKHVGNSIAKEALSLEERAKAGRFIDWIIPAVQSYGSKYDIEIVSSDMLAKRVVETEAKNFVDKSIIMDSIHRADDEIIEKIQENFSFQYPHSEDIGRKMKYSVSDIKIASMLDKLGEEEDQSEKLPFNHSEENEYIPSFALADGMTSEQVNMGALRGTAVHRFMECLDFKGILDIDINSQHDVSSFVRKELDRQLAQGKLSQDMESLIIPATMEKFVASNVAHRMAVADKNNVLYREKPFVMKHEEGYLVQGIIDVFWLEDDRVILLDYKTDSVRNAEELISRYETQLVLYADALRRIFSTKDKEVMADECLLYSFKLQEEIRI